MDKDEYISILEFAIREADAYIFSLEKRDNVLAEKENLIQTIVSLDKKLVNSLKHKNANKDIILENKRLKSALIRKDKELSKLKEKSKKDLSSLQELKSSLQELKLQHKINLQELKLQHKNKVEEMRTELSYYRKKEPKHIPMSEIEKQIIKMKIERNTETFKKIMGMKNNG